MSGICSSLDVSVKGMLKINVARGPSYPSEMLKVFSAALKFSTVSYDSRSCIAGTASYGSSSKKKKKQ